MLILRTHRNRSGRNLPPAPRLEVLLQEIHELGADGIPMKIDRFDNFVRADTVAVYAMQ